MKSALWLVLLAAACTTNRTEMVVIVDQQGLVVGRDFDHLHLTITDVTQADSTRFDSQELLICTPTMTSGCYDLPLVQTLFPGGKSPHDAVRVLVEATLGTKTVISDAATFTFVSGQSSQLDFSLVSACLGNVSCSAQDMICASGGCTTLAPTKLTGNPDLRSAGEPMDAAVGDASAVLDGGMHDAGPRDATMVPPDLTPPPNCMDNIRNGNEGGVDCGGSCPHLCETGSTCNVAADCMSFVCGHQKTCVNLAFTSKQLVSLGFNLPVGIAAGDFAGTGHPGYAMALSGTGPTSEVLIYGGDGTGTFQQYTSVSSYKDAPQALLSHSLTAQHTQDLVVLEYGGSGTTGVIIDPAAGAPTTAVDQMTGSDNDVTGAFDALGGDLFVAGGGGVRRLSTSVAGTLSVVATVTSNAASGVAVGKLDGDALPDVAYVSGTLYVALAATATTYKTATPIGTTASGPSSVILVDLDADGHLDAIVGNSASTSTTGSITIYWGDAGGFSTTGMNLTTTAPQSFVVIAADANHDQIPDIVVASRGDMNNGPSALTVFLNHGDSTRTLEPAFNIALSQRAYAIDAADFNGDGWLDFILACRDGSDGSVLVTNTTP